MTYGVPKFATYLANDGSFDHRLARVLTDLSTFVWGNDIERQRALWAAGEAYAVLAASEDCYLATHGWHEVIAGALLQIAGAPTAVEIIQNLRGAIGQGDVLAMARAIPTLAAAYPGLQVFLRAEDRFERLFANSFPRVTVSRLDTPSATNSETPLEKVWAALSEQSFAWPAPYLHADPALVAHYRAIVPPGAIGLCWAASGGRSDIRSAPLIEMQSIWLRHPCVSLQVGSERGQSDGTKVIDVMPDYPDWAETAALVAACRAVVSVDTSVAHLAGATGAPVHLLARHPKLTFYGEVAGQRPWYPRMQVYLKGDAAWSEVVGRVAAALAA